MIDRRGFLGALPLVAAAVSRPGVSLRFTRPSPARPPTGRELDGLGVQLYTLRDAIAEDLDGTLAAVAQVGYREVELFQLHGLTPAALRAKLDGVGLRAASSHYGVQLIRDDFDRTLEGAQELGQRLVVVPSLPGAERSSDGLRRVADDFNRAGAAARSAGLRFGYHNHDWELRPMADGTVPIELLLDRTEPDLVDWQMDIFWTVHGGGDPLSLLDRRAGRVTSVHVKDRTATGEMVDVGDGVIDFSAVLAAAEQRGLMHAFVEHDQPGRGIRSVGRSFRYLRSIGVAS
ncbi:MAG: sugar phosphate isomerase/epimerase [Gemmatimonadota bacterium]|nr:sugar phosphate isomerase/epimerase [Gemmatimonadota bacterium]